MKKYLYLSVAIVALSLLVSAGVLWADPAASVCPAQGKTCMETAGGIYCTWTETGTATKLVPGRGGQLSYVRVPTTLTRMEKCYEAGHEHR